MTEKLYYADSHLRACAATVLACAPASDADAFDVLLDRTVLFPTGGGQPTDLGVIGGAKVIACREESDDVVHRVDAALPVGKTVQVTLDWARRFDFMQQHTGEHLLSFSAYKLFGAANVGFHLAENYTTIDFDTPLDGGQLAAAEELANAYVWRNLPVTATLYPDEAAIADLPLRKHAEGLVAPIRIVAVEDADCCTCCAPHCDRTGEIGSILVTDFAAYKGGTRVTFLCGKRALIASRQEHDALDNIARRFSVQRGQAENAVAKLSDAFASCKHSEKLLAAKCNAYLAAELALDAVKAGRHSVIVAAVQDRNPGQLKDLAQTVAKGDTLALLFAETDGKLAYVLSAGDAFGTDVAEIMPVVNAAAGGKGGGRGTLAQGMAPARGGVAETVEQLKRYFEKSLR